ncbi:MAG: hypothetical protein ABIO43_12620 [Sphingomicrobium sp.]
MEKRPLSLTIIGWFLMISAVLSLFGTLTMGSNPVAMKMLEQMQVSLAFQQAMAVIGAVVAAISAYGIFKGLPWSRVLYAGWSVIGLVVGFFISPAKLVMLLSVVFAAVIIYFLFRPAADRWFAAKGLQLQRGAA